MHTYQYRCRTCGRHFEVNSSNSESEQGPECPYCQSTDCELNLSSLFAPEKKFDKPPKLATASNCGSPGPFS